MLKHPRLRAKTNIYVVIVQSQKGSLENFNVAGDFQICRPFTNGRMVSKILFKKLCNLYGLFGTRIFKRSIYTKTKSSSVSESYKYLLILDLEATCDKIKFSPQEIIEFPCLKINQKTTLEEGRFHQYVRPVFNPILSNFCTDLTGIVQSTVDESKPFPEVYKMFEEWRKLENLTEKNSVYITSGDWDLGHMIPQQCAISNMEVPSHMCEWIDIKKLFGNNNDVFYNSFTDVMKHYNFQFTGRAHSGIDDCLNILQVVKKMIELGIEFKPTSRLSNLKVETIISQKS